MRQSRAVQRNAFFVSFVSISTASLAVTTVSLRAEAADFEVTSDTAAQFYDVRSPTGENVLMRRRMTTTLGVGAYNILDRTPENPSGPEITFRARMRYDADYGAGGLETDPSSFARFVPGYSRGPVDLMYGYIEGRRFASGYLGFKLGRQYMTDALGWWSFDGGLVRVTTPFFVAVEGYGGLEVRGGLPLSSPRFERDGVWRGDRSGYDPSLYPSFQRNDVAPAMGVALESVGPTWIHARATYRRVLNTGESNLSQFTSGLTQPISYDATRVSQERIGYALDATLGNIAGFKGGFAYDLYLRKMGNVYASVDTFVTQKLTASLDYDFYQPTFDADSIWNFFASEPMNDFGVRATYDATPKLSVSGGGHARMYNVRTSPDSTSSSANVSSTVNTSYFPTNGTPFDEGGDLSARYRWGQGILGARARGNFGSGGDRVGGDLNAERVIETRYVVSGRASLWQWNDKLRPDRDAVSVGYVAGLGYLFGPRSKAMFEFEHTMNRLVGQRFRAMLWLTVAVTK